ncbi:hypothetical protein [Bradyrhizobium sp. 143]|uniref:hypothetical protein n=1 Tax=Bradyrhizobium sp. 143 TaxID=2782619 RepID=UPI001FFA7816|nr:hypothetical protein [Bradyrhizobium sp. 143]MCK1710474.1 hypothetical protein [Bradyrhizobium sp. 143]
MQQLETTIVSLAKRGEQLVAKRVTAQAALDSGNSGPPGYSPVGGPRRSTGARQAAGCVVAATSDLAGIDDALAVLAHQKAEGERQLAAESERIKRATAADKLAKQVTAIEAALPAYLEQSRALTDALSEIGHWHFESGQMAGFLQNTRARSKLPPTSPSRS